jgi:hypothetical protein
MDGGVAQNGGEETTLCIVGLVEESSSIGPRICIPVPESFA